MNIFCLILSITIALKIEGDDGPVYGAPVKEVLSEYSAEISQEQFNKLFIRRDLNHLLLSDAERIINELKQGYPDFL